MSGSARAQPIIRVDPALGPATYMTRVLVAAGDPGVELGGFVADRRRVAVTGVDDGVGREREQLRADRLDDRREVREGPAGRAGPAVEQRVAAVDRVTVRVVEADAAGGVARRVQRDERRAGHVEARAVLDQQVRRALGVHGVPEHQVVGVQRDGRADGVGHADGIAARQIFLHFRTGAARGSASGDDAGEADSATA